MCVCVRVSIFEKTGGFVPALTRRSLSGAALLFQFLLTCGIPMMSILVSKGMPVVVPGSGIALPSTARLHLQKNDWASDDPLHPLRFWLTRGH